MGSWSRGGGQAKARAPGAPAHPREGEGRRAVPEGRGAALGGPVLGRCHRHPSFPLLGPQCPLPFDAAAAAGGVIRCERASGPGGAAIQQCQLLCRQGYRSAFPPRPLVCSLERRRWVSQPPQPRACQREWPWGCLSGTPLPLVFHTQEQPFHVRQVASRAAGGAK